MTERKIMPYHGETDAERALRQYQNRVEQGLDTEERMVKVLEEARIELQGIRILLGQIAKVLTEQNERESIEKRRAW